MLGGFDVLHVSKPDVRTCLPALFASRRAGVKVVVTTEHVVQRAASRYPLGSAVVAALVRRANRSVDRIITVSEMSRQAYVENYGGDPARVLAIRNGVDLDRFRALPDRAASRQSLGLRREDIVTTVVGRLVPGKGHAAAIESVSALAGRVPRLRLLVVGDGPLASDLARLAAAMRVRDRVVFAGTRHDIDAVLSASDLLLLASEAESLPFAVLEAMAAALPVVATAVGALAEAVEDGVTGRLVPVGDPDALAGALADVLTSPDRGAAMGIAGRARAEAAFDARSNHRRVAQLYDELLEAAEARHAR